MEQVHQPKRVSLMHKIRMAKRRNNRDAAYEELNDPTRIARIFALSRYMPHQGAREIARRAG